MKLSYVKKIAPFLGMTIGLVACDMPITYQFSVTNKTTAPCKLIYAISLKQDTIALEPGQTKVITQVTNIARSKYDYYKNMNNILYTAFIKTTDEKAPINVADRNLWQLSWPKKRYCHVSPNIRLCFFLANCLTNEINSFVHYQAKNNQCLKPFITIQPTRPSSNRLLTTCGR